jgi:hypothetical protein
LDVVAFEGDEAEDGIDECDDGESECRCEDERVG